MSDETQSIYNFPPQVAGTTFKAVQFQVLNPINPPTTALSAVSCVFKKDGAVTLTPNVTINSGANWIFTIGPVATSSMGIAGGIHEFDIKTTDAGGVVRKYVSGNMVILPSQQ